jgi:hypothetical protein
MSSNDRLDYEFLIRKYSWITTENQKTIISPDVDGILCGLFMSHYYNWEIVGYYDGKQLAIKQNVRPSECIFLDVEIYRQKVRSCGHHIVLYNKRNPPSSWENLSNCINPNVIRGYDAYNNFQAKYPFATIHFLLCIISFQEKITIPKSAIPPLLYVDGTFKNLLNYPENCISWLNFFNAKDPNSAIYPIYVLFANRKIAGIIHDLEIIFEKFKEIAGGKRGGDKIKILDISNNSFSGDSIVKIEKLINLLAESTGWKYIPEKWILKGLNVLNFSKKIKENLNNKEYLRVVNQKPLSWAITGKNRGMEYTLEKPDKFL